MKFVDQNTLQQHFKGKENYMVRLIYDQWEAPGSTKREQIIVGPLSIKDVLKEYGDFKYNATYTTGFTKENIPTLDVWAVAVGEKRYKNISLEEKEL